MLLFSFHSFAQSQHNNWYFGQGGAITFNGGGPISITGSLWTTEGSSSISDENGVLLFYTNGQNVWGSNDVLMPNGTGLFGQYSSSQSALIAPYPGSDSLFYIFTVPAEAGTFTGNTGPTGSDLTYSMVDMSLNGGLGDVTIKNSALNGPMTEKLTATRHANGRDVWVVTHGWGNSFYYSYLITCNGVSTPVISDVGRTMDLTSTNNYLPAIGCMRISPQGDRLAATWQEEYGFGNFNALIDILQFNNTTGTVSAPISFDLTPTDSCGSYGVAFSPDGTRLYLSGGDTIPKIYQYDMTAANIPASEVVVATSGGGPGFGTLQLGPDGALYLARSAASAPFISVITSPNVLGAGCGFNSPGVTLTSGNSTFGLPNHWDTYPEPMLVDLIPFDDTTACAGAITLDATFVDPPQASMYLWNTGSTDPAVNADTSGTYTVEVLVGCLVHRDTVVVTVSGPAVDLGDDQRLCEGQSLVLSVPEGPNDVLWMDGTTENEILISDTGSVVVIVTDSNGCSASDLVLIHDRGCRCNIYVPNSFTPNGDGHNDVFQITVDCLLNEFTFSLYDRWGQELFISEDPVFRWEGPKSNVVVPPTVLIWTMDYAWIDTIGSHRAHRKGDLTVVR